MELGGSANFWERITTELVCHRKGTANDLPGDKRQNLAMTFDAFEAIVFGVARQSNVQSHFLAARGAFNLHTVLRDSSVIRICSRHQASREDCCSGLTPLKVRPLAVSLSVQYCTHAEYGLAMTHATRSGEAPTSESGDSPLFSVPRAVSKLHRIHRIPHFLPDGCLFRVPR